MSQPEPNEKELQDLYFQIIEGYTPAEIGEERVWVKHFDLATQAKVDSHYNRVYEDAKEKGLPVEKDLLSALIEEGSWSQEESDEIEAMEKVVQGLHASKAKVLTTKMQEVIESNINDREKALEELQAKKRSLLHDTCEDIARRRSNDLVVKLAFCKNKEATPFFSEEDFEYLERADIYRTIGIYNTATVHLNSKNIKRISALDFFTSYYGVVEENPTDFFNKPIHQLTFFQINLLNYGKLINTILKNFNPPVHIRNDAVALMAFAESESKKQKKTSQRKGTRG